ncbi:MAG: hypothetical protein HKL87_02525 [Acidimicrobiaceae bacterium]|nr:hypothetical protein [Acidimicrobiaceae bacterium]
MSELSPEQRLASIADVDRRIKAHPMHRIRIQLDSLVEVLRFVLSPNGQDLLELLTRASTDPETFLSLTAAQQFSPAALRFRAGLSRQLHNYLASAYTLHAQAKEVMQSRDRASDADELRDEWNRRAGQFDKDPPMAFVMGLRAYVQHYGQLPVGHRLHVNVAESSGESELTITVSELDAPVRWNSAARAFINSTEMVDIRPLFAEHLDRTAALYRWLIEQIIVDSNSMLDEYNELIAERATFQFGVDLETARTLVEPPVTRIRRESEEAVSNSGEDDV